MHNSKQSLENFSIMPPISRGVSVIKMSSLIIVDDQSVSDYHVLPTENTFLKSSSGAYVWAEHNGSALKLDGAIQAKLVQTDKGPVVEFYNEVDDVLSPRFTIKCIDLMGVAPTSDVQGRIHEYRDLIKQSVASRVFH